MCYYFLFRDLEFSKENFYLIFRFCNAKNSRQRVKKNTYYNIKFFIVVPEKIIPRKILQKIWNTSECKKWRFDILNVLKNNAFLLYKKKTLNSTICWFNVFISFLLLYFAFQIFFIRFHIERIYSYLII